MPRRVVGIIRRSELTEDFIELICLDNTGLLMEVDDTCGWLIGAAVHDGAIPTGKTINSLNPTLLGVVCRMCGNSDG